LANTPNHPLTGIFHLAGVPSTDTVMELSRQGMKKVMSSKVLGAYHLHAASAHLDLKHFVVFVVHRLFWQNPGQY